MLRAVKSQPALGRRIVKRAMHGTRLMSWSEVRETYGRELVNLRNEGRYTFLNTLFSVSEAVLYMQVGPFASGLREHFILYTAMGKERWCSMCNS